MLKRLSHSSCWIALVALAACGEAPEDVSAIESKVIYGTDDREDVFEVDGALGDLARQSVVSIFAGNLGVLDESDPANVRINADSVGRALGLCKSERFWSDPSAAECSGTLIADDLVLTAGHCFESGAAERTKTPAEVCKTRRFVFGYYNDAEDKLHRITSEDVFSCAELVAHRKDSPNGTSAVPVLDFAVVRLERSAAPRFKPVNLRPDSALLAVGEPLTVLGFPSGIPLKVAAGGSIITVHDKGDFFIGTTDTFAGNSGSGIFDSNTLEQIGILIAGQPDYVKKGSCSVAAQCAETGCAGQSERIQQIAPVVAAYCTRSDAKANLCKET